MGIAKAHTQCPRRKGVSIEMRTKDLVRFAWSWTEVGKIEWLMKRWFTAPKFRLVQDISDFDMRHRV